MGKEEAFFSPAVRNAVAEVISAKSRKEAVPLARGSARVTPTAWACHHDLPFCPPSHHILRCYCKAGEGVARAHIPHHRQLRQHARCAARCAHCQWHCSCGHPSMALLVPPPSQPRGMTTYPNYPNSCCPALETRCFATSH